MVFLSFLFLSPHQADASALPKPPNNLGLVGYWSMNDCSASLATDFSGNSNTGTLTNFALSGATSNWETAGKRGCALSFDGTDDYVDAGDVTALNSASAYTISGWAKQTTLDQSRWIFGKSTANCVGSSNCIVMETYSDGYLYVEVRNGGASYGYLDYSQYVTAGTWFHYTVVFDGSQSTNATRLKLYIDGVQRTLTYVGTIPATTGNLSGRSFLIGQSDSGGAIGMWNGSIDETRIYNRALTAPEVTALYGSGSAKISGASSDKSAGLVGHWKLDDRTGTSATDSVGTNTGTLTNGPTWSSGYRGGAVTFDGVDDRVTTGNISFPTTSSVCLWIYPRANATSELVLHGTTTATQTGFEIFQSGLAVGLRGSAGGFMSTGNVLVLNQWQFICGTISGTSGNIYYNGALSTTGSVVTPQTSANHINIGAYEDGSYPFNGSIDDVRVYNTALTAEEVRNLYASGTARPTIINSTSSRIQGSNLASGLVGHWTFDGSKLSTTTATDSSTSANNGTLTNGPVPALGKLGQALNFDGTDDYVSVPSTSSLKPANISICGWVKSNAYSALTVLMGKQSGGGYGSYGLVFRTGPSRMTFTISKTGPQTEYFATSTNQQTGVWQHWCGTYDGTTQKLFLNGVLEDTQTPSITIDQTDTYPLTIGTYTSGLYPLSGSLDEVRVYNRALTEGEVTQLYNMGR